MWSLEITGFDCGGSVVLSIIKFIMSVLDFVFVLVPIGLALLLVVDFFKNVMASSEGEMDKNKKMAIMRVIFCIALFLVEPVTHTIINIASRDGDSYVSCINIALNEDISKYKIEKKETDTTQYSVDLGNKKKDVIVKGKSDDDSSENTTEDGTTTNDGE